MKTRKLASISQVKDEPRDEIEIRHCHGIEEFENCVRIEREVWRSADIDVVPIPLFVIASHTGGQVIGAFAGSELVGFAMAIAGWRDDRPFLHSHMAAVAEAYRNRGIGRGLKLFQRKDALSRGIHLVEWTFDPLVTRNAYFNFMKLGAMARRYLPNAYGITTSPLHGSLPTDRLVAEWHLKSKRVRDILAGKKIMFPTSEKSVRIAIPSKIEQVRETQPTRAAEFQSEIGANFLRWFDNGYAATAIVPSERGMDYILEPWSAP